MPSDHAFSDTWVWNEGMPADIPELHGHRVILLGTLPTLVAAARGVPEAARGARGRGLLDEEAVAEWLERIERAASKR